MREMFEPHIAIMGKGLSNDVLSSPEWEAFKVAVDGLW